MTTIADFEIDASTVALGETFDTLPELTCSVEQVIAAADRGLWFEGADRSELEAALEDDPTVDDVALIAADKADGQLLYDVTMGDDALDVFELILEERGTVLSASANEGRWHLRVRFIDHDDASRLYDRLEESEANSTLKRLTELREAPSTTDRLTEKQYETLLTAFEQGYFTIPRETSMEELADELGISHQALSERFRRAYRELVLTALNGTHPTHPEDDASKPEPNQPA
ncbi:helix-turn-helix domain-containing protein [Saliphagus sp. GCM10025308]|uniref:helix-turn-helix domain-containing protein n=1 Tax=Natronosalvus caseinilyticus TaxID=2953747 RepID=UPI0028A613BB|nr:helix-turn-helix domain-containing protein [Natronosalvus caseinilyticus]